MSEIPDAATAAFLEHRSLLFTVAYEMLASAADAEDVLQESWVRWSDVDQDEVRDARAYLVRIVTRQSLNQLRTRQRRRETYVGQWLPEPLLTAPDVADDVVLADSVSVALLLVLESLSPTERAVFVLREVFDVGYDEIAAAVDKSAAAVRQIAHRARGHVEARRPREAVHDEQARAVVDSFRRATETGDLQSLLDVLAPDVVLIADGGGFKTAAPRPVAGADNVARFLLGTHGKAAAPVRIEPTTVNGRPALRVLLGGVLDGIVAARVLEGRISGLYYVRNPEKLARWGREVLLVRR